MSCAVIFLDIFCVIIGFYNGNLRKGNYSKKCDHLLIVYPIRNMFLRFLPLMPFMSKRLFGDYE